MDIQQLAEEAGRIINTSPIRNAGLMLQMPGKWGKSNYRYLSGKKSPKGEIVQENDNGIIVRFDPVDVLAFCVANGAEVNIVSIDDEAKNAE